MIKVSYIVRNAKLFVLALCIFAVAGVWLYTEVLPDQAQLKGKVTYSNTFLQRVMGLLGADTHKLLRDCVENLFPAVKVVLITQSKKFARIC